jgi:hypothetical protein
VKTSISISALGALMFSAVVAGCASAPQQTVADWCRSKGFTEQKELTTCVMQRRAELNSAYLADRAYDEWARCVGDSFGGKRRGKAPC